MQKKRKSILFILIIILLTNICFAADDEIERGTLRVDEVNVRNVDENSITLEVIMTNIGYETKEDIGGYISNCPSSWNCNSFVVESLDPSEQTSENLEMIPQEPQAEISETVTIVVEPGAPESNKVVNIDIMEWCLQSGSCQIVYGGGDDGDDVPISKKDEGVEVAGGEGGAAAKRKIVFNPPPKETEEPIIQEEETPPKAENQKDNIKKILSSTEKIKEDPKLRWIISVIVGVLGLIIVIVIIKLKK